MQALIVPQDCRFRDLAIVQQDSTSRPQAFPSPLSWIPTGKCTPSDGRRPQCCRWDSRSRPSLSQRTCCHLQRVSLGPFAEDPWQGWRSDYAGFDPQLWYLHFCGERKGQLLSTFGLVDACQLQSQVLKLCFPGVPLSELPTVEKPDSITSNLLNGQGGRLGRTAVPKTSPTLHTPTNIAFVRSRMMYSRSALNAKGDVQFGLRHIREYPMTKTWLDPDLFRCVQSLSQP